MQFLSRLRHVLEPFAIPNLAIWLIAGEVFLYLAGMAEPKIRSQIELIPANVLAGEYWRLLTFPIVPMVMNPLFLFFKLYFFYLMGRVLEQHWGSLRFNAFFLIGYVATVSSVFLYPQILAHNGFIVGSVFLAFAHLYPKFVIQLMFVFPIQIRWIALVTWLFIISQIFWGDAPSRVHAVAGVANFVLFFGRDVLRNLISGEGRVRRQMGSIRTAPEVRHCCVVCGVTDASDSTMEFRYCSKCEGNACYCSQHLHQHEHRI